VFGSAPRVKTIIPIDRTINSVIVDSKYRQSIAPRVAGVLPNSKWAAIADVALSNSPALLGTVRCRGWPDALCGACLYRKSGDAWGIRALDRLIDEQRLVRMNPRQTPEMTSMLQRMRQIGQRTAGTSRALGLSRMEALRGRPISQEDSARWSDAIMSRATHVSKCCRKTDRLGEPAKLSRKAETRRATCAH
jgi:hypothetical protein